MRMHRNRWILLAVFLLMVGLIQFGGSRMTLASVHDWYLELKKPDWTPPSWVFGPVWTILYLSIAVAGWLVAARAKACSMKRIAFAVYALQLGANLAWSYFFFFLKSPLLGLIDLIALVILIALNIGCFIRLYAPAGWLLIPYFLWTVYAFFLNLAIWMG